jgi:aspartyl-tRNA(Asn)/glutamyl-tRNA(Gln) amidotransferase subunit A
MMNPEDLSLAGAAAAIRAGTLSPVEYVESLFRLMDRIEARVQAWVTVDRESVLREARECESEAKRGHFRGPLHGVPLGIKDIFYTRGLRTTMGSVIYKDFVPDRDARAVAKLKQAGAIVLGKTVTTVFANLDPGPTRNPWNLEHTPGGSSSGSAAAVAARMCPAAIGSQTIGSVGRPAAFCGVASLVPAQQRISLKDMFPLAWSLDHVGVFARSVADIEMMLDPMVESPVERSSKRGPFRIGLLRGFFYENATPEAQSLNDRLADQLAAAGFRVEESRLPAIFDLHQPILRTILRSETSSIHERLFAEHAETYGPKLRSLIETGMLIDARDYLRARRLRHRYQREMATLFEKFDALMTPPAKGTAPAGIETTGDPVMNGPWTLTDFPTMTLPHALGADGLPIGVQLTGPPLQEGLLLAIAKAVEKVVGFRARPILEKPQNTYSS